MKNKLFTYGKKSLAIVMTVMMLMTCWVFIPASHEHLEAEAAGEATAEYNASLVNGLSELGTTVTTMTGSFDGDTAYTTQDYYNQLYKNVLRTSRVVLSSNDPSVTIRPAKWKDNNPVDRIGFWYPETVLLYDGQTTPEFGIMLEIDAGSNRNIRSRSGWISANANGLTWKNTYWKGLVTGKLDHTYLMFNSGATDHISTDGTEHSGKVFNTGSGDWKFVANNLRFTATMSNTEYLRTITPTFSISAMQASGDSWHSESGVATKKIYVINYVPIKNAIPQVNSWLREIKNNPGKYTTECVKSFVDLYNKMAAAHPNKFASASVNNPTGYNSAASAAMTAYNSFSLVTRKYDITFENMFSISDWMNSESYNYQSNDSTEIKVEENKTIKIFKKAAGGELTTSSSYPNTHSNTRYAMPVDGGKAYTVSYNTTSSISGAEPKSEIFLFWYDVNNNPVNNTAGSATFNNQSFTGNGYHEVTFTAPAGAAKAEIRFDNDCSPEGSTVRFNNIAVYPAERGTEFAIKDWSSRPTTKAYASGAALGTTLPVPVRQGYNFNGWYLDGSVSADGKFQEGERVTDANGTVIEATQSFAVTSHYNLYADWAPQTTDVGYDNLFSLSKWSLTESAKPSNSRGEVKYDLEVGTITVNSTKDGEEYTSYGSAGNHYQIAVKPGTEYIFEADMDINDGGYTGQMFVFFYDASGSGVTGAIYNGTAQQNSHIGIYPAADGTYNITFTAPANCAKISFRVGATQAGATATYSNIGLYEKADYDAYAKDYAKVREPFKLGDAIDLFGPTRDGYVFDGWELADGTKITSTEGLTESTTVYATWTKLWTVTYYYGDSFTELATVKVKDGETVGTLPTVTPTKDSNDQYSYEFYYWMADTKEFTKDTKITSDLRVYPVFNNIPHGNFNYILEDPSTCEENATVIKSCGGCGYKFNNGNAVTYNPDEDPNADSHQTWLAKGHSYTGGTIMGTGDVHFIKCARYSACGSTIEEPHAWDGNISQGATCVIPGTIKKTCPCGAQKDFEGEVDPSNHVNTRLINVVAPDCENDGYTGDTYCDDCKKIVANGTVDPKLGHSFTNYVSDGNATCTADGTETAKCDRCDETDTQTEAGSMIPHKYTNYVYNNDAKCGVDGTKTALCDYGCETEDTVKAEGTARTHEFTGEVKNNENGTHSYECKYDDCDVYGGTTDCTYGAWSNTEADTHTKACTECSYEVTEGHSWSAWTTTDNYKNEAGEHSRSCTVCGRVETEACTYTSKEFKVTCTTDGYTLYTCDCGHMYTVAGTTKTGHNYTGTAKSYNNGQHNFLCVNDCGTYGVGADKDARTACTYGYVNNKTGEHQATCTACSYTFAEECSGGQASCTTLKVCEKCEAEYGTTDPHSFTGTPVVLNGDEHAYLCEYCSTAGLYGVGAEQGATEACSGGTATCIALAECTVCKDTHGDYAAHVYDGTPVQLAGDVHAYRCSVCNNDTLYGVGSTDNATEACSGGDATCTALAVCDVCNDTHGELDEDDHKWSKWANVAGTETHKHVCEYNNEHTETEDCFSPDISVVAPDCETAGYTVNECIICDHVWHTNPTEALDHDWSAWENNNDGTHTRVCEAENCKYGENGTAKVETADCSKDNADAVVTAPECLEEGYTTYTCNDCGYVWVDDYTDATGHSYAEHKKVDSAAYKRSDKDCVTDETYWYRCDNCDVSAGTEVDKYEDITVLYWVSEAAVGHKYEAKTVADEFLASEATCTDRATYYYSCSACGESSEGTAAEKTFTNGSALGHAWTETEKYLKSEADCINNEVYYKECSRCYISSENETGETWEKADSLKGHDFDHEAGYTAGVEATCTSDGVVEHYTCEVCDKHFAADKVTEIAESKLVIPALNHSYQYVAYKVATCEEAGNNEHYKCLICGHRTVEDWEIPAKGHEFKAENGYYSDATNGYHAYYCTRYNDCGAYGVEDVKYSAEYDGLDWVIVGGIKCTFTGEYVNYEADGKHSHKLTCVCGNESSAVCEDAEPVHVLPDCINDGYYIHTCDVCSFEWNVASDAEEDKALDHDLKVVPNNDGTHSMVCNRTGCDYAEAAVDCSTETPATACGTYDICDICKTAFGEAKPHVFTNYVYNNDAECGVNGTKTAECDTCDANVTDTITAENTALDHIMVEFADADALRYKTAGVWYYNNAFGYDLSKWAGKPADFDETTIVRPNCKIDGRAISYCTREGCDHYTTKVASKVDDEHIWSETETVVGGNCATGVTFKRECTVCGKATTRVEAVEHSYVLRALESANCESAELRYSVCSVCGDDKEELIGEPLGHDWATEVIDKEATCAHPGRMYSICSRCNTASEKTEIPRLGHVWEEDGFNYDEYIAENPNANILYVEASEATCEFEGYNGYYKCFSCSYDQHLDEEWRKDNIIAKESHEDNDGDSKCDECNTKIYGEDGDKNCSCICHKENWFSKIIYKILCFFWKLFGIGKSCDCGTVHY